MLMGTPHTWVPLFLNHTWPHALQMGGHLVRGDPNWKSTLSPWWWEQRALPITLTPLLWGTADGGLIGNWKPPLKIRGASRSCPPPCEHVKRYIVLLFIHKIVSVNNDTLFDKSFVKPPKKVSWCRTVISHTVQWCGSSSITMNDDC